MVSLIQSNYRDGFWNGSSKLGFMLQDRGELFDLEEESPTLLRQKNVLSYNIPAFVTKDQNPL
jgi:gamma-glutamyltranspeptidase/glutathione hydrolase